MGSTAAEARAAHESHDWSATLEILEGLGEQGHLDPNDLLLKADALYWTGRFDEAIATFEQAHARFVETGQSAEAGLVAGWLAYFAVRRQSFSVARGWVTQAQKLLDGAPDSLGHAWLKLLHIGIALFIEGDVSGAITRCDDAIEFATSIGSPSSQSAAMSFKGLAMIQTEDWRAGLELMDEAMIVAMTGSDDLRMTSDVYCNTISACRNLGDYRRAGEWTEEADRWMQVNSVAGYTGACQVHRAELKLFKGSWVAAEEEARRACDELDRFRLVDYLGSAHYEIGEVRRRMGDLENAEKEFEQAYAGGHDAQPGLSLLMLARGDVEEALASIKGAAIRKDSQEDGMWRGPSRARLLPALVEIAVAAGDFDLASSAAEEMAEIADAFDSAVWKAQSAASRGSVALAHGEVESAVELLDAARSAFRSIDLPYEMARSQMLLGEARRQLGDETRGRLDLSAARDVMRALGAAPELQALNEQLGDDDSQLTSAVRVTRTFVFTDIVKSTDLIGVIGDDSWRELLSWHDRTIRAAIEQAGGEVVRHTGDGFFATFIEARRAVDGAVDIQRRLREHRRKAGFAPFVRIGLHEAEATLNNGDYSGGGVHAAARIGALAGAEEILMSTDTLHAAGPVPYPIRTKRNETLKGISQPVEVCSLDWH